MTQFSKDEKQKLIDFFHSETLLRIDCQTAAYKKKRILNLVLVVITLILVKVCLSLMAHSEITQAIKNESQSNFFTQSLSFLIFNFEYFALGIVGLGFLHFCIYTFMILKNQNIKSTLINGKKIEVENDEEYNYIHNLKNQLAERDKIKKQLEAEMSTAPIPKANLLYAIDYLGFNMLFVSIGLMFGFHNLFSVDAGSLLYSAVLALIVLISLVFAYFSFRCIQFILINLSMNQAFWKLSLFHFVIKTQESMSEFKLFSLRSAKVLASVLVTFALISLYGSIEQVPLFVNIIIFLTISIGLSVLVLSTTIGMYAKNKY